MDCGGAPPRVLGLDDYFMTEVEKVKKDPDTGRGVKTKVSFDDLTDFQGLFFSINTFNWKIHTGVLNMSPSQVLEYEYEPEMEDTYRSSMLKTFKKTLDDGFFPFIILDTINEKVKHFEPFWSAAKTKGFEVCDVLATKSVERFFPNRPVLTSPASCLPSRFMWLKSLQIHRRVQKETSTTANSRTS